MLLTALLGCFDRAFRIRRRTSNTRRWQPADFRVEQLESRIVPYVASGNLWAHPELVTISFAPDGTNINGYSSDLYATFDAKFGSSTAWQNQMLKAAQAWAQQTNLNFTVVSDNGADNGSGDYQQGSPGFGDIRIFGYDFGTSTLALAYQPPPINNYSIAGDIQFNSGQTWNIGSTYDVFTVSMHEFGHALGLNHSASASAVMYSAYNGTDSGLSSDDINGIRNIYSANAARSSDSYDAAASNGTFGTATSITSLINTTSKTALVNNLDITTISDLDYYKFTAPTGGTGTLVVHVQSSGLSLLTPKIWVYNNSQTQLATATGTGYLGSNLTATVSVVAGQNYYLKVDGADATAFGTGKYAVTLNFGTNADPTVPLPNTQVPNGNPLSGGGGDAIDGRDYSRRRDHDHGNDNRRIWDHPSGSSDASPADDNRTYPSTSKTPFGPATLDWDILVSVLNKFLG